MIYLKLLVNKFHLLLLPPILLSALIDYKVSTNPSYLNFILLFAASFLMVSLALAFRKLKEIRRFQPLKIMLQNSDIVTSGSQPNQITILAIISCIIFIILTIGLYLSTKSGATFFFIGIISFIFVVLAFMPRLNLFDKTYGTLYSALFLGSILFLASNQFVSANFDMYLNYYSISMFSIVFLISSIEDLQRINTDFKDGKTTIASKIGVKSYRKIVLLVSLLAYILQIFLVILTLNVWHLIPLFSVTIAANIFLKIWNRYGVKLNDVFAISVIFYYFHVLLIGVSVFASTKV